MLPANEDKKMLIQSMKKLTHHISNNPIRQKQIFDSLTKNDLLKIVTNLSDDNQYLRRISGLLLAELFYNNDQIKKRAIKMLQLFPIYGRICLNQIPTAIQKFPSTLKKCVELMKSSIKQDQTDKFCWTINLDRKILQIQFLQYKKYSSFTFLDPNRNIFGFTFIDDNKVKHKKQTIQKSRQKSSNSIDSNLSSKRQSIGINSSFYKNYIQNKSRKHQSPSSYREYYQKKQIIKLNTPKNPKPDYMMNTLNGSVNRNLNTIQSISQYAKANKQTFNQSATTPLKNKDPSLKLDITSISQSLRLGGVYQANNQIKSPLRSSQRQISNSHRAPQTDRKHDNSNKSRMFESALFNNSTNQKIKYPVSTKNSYLNQHQKFYKRVKEILKR